MVYLKTAILLLSLSSLAAPPDNRPPDNRPPGNDPSPVPAVTHTVDIVNSTDLNSNTDVNITTPKKVKIKTPAGIGLATPDSALGFCLTLLPGGGCINIPWGHKDKQKLAVYDRLMAADQFEAAYKVLCTTKPLYKWPDCVELLTPEQIIIADVDSEAAHKEHEELKARIKKLELELQQERTAQQRSKQTIDKNEERRRRALEQLKGLQ